MRVGELMTLQPVTVSEETSMREALELMRKHQIRHLPVVEGRLLRGIVTDRDVRRAAPSLLSGIEMEQYESILDGTPVARIMTRDPFTVTAEADVAEAVQVMVDRKIGSLPVVDGSELVGIFTEIDALRLLLQTLRGTAHPASA